MKFSIKTQALLQAISKMSSVFNSKTPMPILSSIKIKAAEHVLITAFNLDIGMVSRLDAEILNPGEIAVPGKPLLDLLQTILEETLTFEVEKNVLTVNTGSIKAKFKIHPGNDYPALPSFNVEFATLKHVEIVNLKFVNAIKKVIYAASKSEDSQFNGVLLGSDAIVALDGHRLALKKIFEGEIEDDVIVSRRTLAEMKKLIESDLNVTYKMYFHQNFIVLNSRNMMFFSGILDQDFPEYEAVIFKSNLKTIIKKSDIIDVLKRTVIFVEPKMSGVVLSFSGSKLNISAENDTFGEIDENIEIVGELESKLKCNIHYLIEAIEAIDADSIQFYVNEDSSAIKILPNNSEENIVSIIMPMR